MVDGTNEEKKAVDEEVKIEITPDKLFAFASFYEAKEGGNAITAEKIVKRLQEAGIAFGIKSEEIQLMPQNPNRFNEKMLVAEGIKTIDGENGYVENKLTIEEKGPKLQEDGTVDFYNLNLIHNIVKDTLIAELMPPKEGTNGKNILGQELIAKPGKQVILYEGKNTRLSEDKMKLYAATNGELVKSDGKYSILDMYEVSGDVDAETGNIEFLGSITIKGNVRKGYSVKAEGNLTVNGVVEGAVIIAGGDIMIAGGIQGNNACKIEAKGNLYAKFIENSEVIVYGNITSASVMHSNVKCGGLLEANGKAGLVVGGNISAYKGIVAKSLGSHMATQTNLVVGQDLKLLENYRALSDELKKAQTELIKMEQIVAVLSKKKDLGQLVGPQIELYEKSQKTQEYLEKKVPDLESQTEAILKQLDQANDYNIKVEGPVHSGVRVEICGEKKTINDDISFCRIYKKNGEIVISQL